MARRPLWPSWFVLVAALLAAPAAASDVAVPTDGGGVPVSGGAGTAGTALSAGANPVSVVPTLTAGLVSPAAAPLAAPAAAMVPLAPSLLTAPVAAAPAPLKAPAAVAPISHATPFNAPGFVGYDASRPTKFPTAVNAAAPGVGNAFYSPGDGTAAGAADHELGHDLFGHPAGYVPANSGNSLADFVDELKAKMLFDGSKPHDPLAETGPGVAAKPAVPALAPLSKAAASSGFEPEAKAAPPVVEAPTPPGADAFDALSAKISLTASSLWSKIKQGFGAKPPPQFDMAARIDQIINRVHFSDDPLETPEGILVHAPRALRFDALGYRVHFVSPDGGAAMRTFDAPVRVRVERGAGDAGTEALRARFASFNALIEANFAALELIAQSSSKMTVKTARLVAAKVEEMARDYATMVGPENSVDATAGVAALAIGLDQEVKGLSDGDLLPAKAVELVMPLEKESLHFYINKLHQDALREVGRTDVESPANLVVKLGRGPSERAVSLVDLSEHPLVKGGRLVSPAFKALIEAMRRSKDQPTGSLLLQDHQFWGHFKLGAHSAEVYANFLPPDEGGMIRVRYQEWGTGYDNQTRLYYVARLLQKTGFHVEQDNGFLTAVVDKDHASQTVDEMTDTFALVVQALHATVGVDFALPLLVQGAKTSEEVGARIDQWVDVVLGEGTLPFYVHDDHNGMVNGWTAYRAQDAARAALRAELNRTLARLGLPAIPAEETLGQRTIDRFVNAPVEAAIARGQLKLTADGKLEKVAGYDPLAGLARDLTSDAPAAGRMAEAVSSLDPGLFRFETVGSLGALTVERAERALEPDSWVTIYALRDPKTGQIGLADAALSDLKPGGAPRRLDAAALFSRLGEQGYPVAAFAPTQDPPGLEHFTRLLKSEPLPERSLGRRAQGLAASPGHGRPVLARVTYDKEKAARGGYVFVAPYTTPDDLDAIRGSKAVLTTSGGLLSHAAITTREMGIPAAILPRAEWRDGAATLESPEFGDAYETDGLTARPRRAGAAASGAALPEGALVRLDPGSGAVEVFPDSVRAPLLDAASALERYDADRDAGALVAWVRQRLGSVSLGSLQQAALVREALDELGARALARPEAAADLAKFYAALPKGKEGLAPWVEDSASGLFDGAKRDALEFLTDKREAAADAISVEAVERALRAGEARAARLAAVAAALGRPKDALVAADLSLASLRGEARSRGAKLLAEDVEELSRHARLFPNATVEVLPRLKAAIAKAKRRGAPAELIAGWEAKVQALEGTREASMRASAPAVLALRQVLDMDVPRVGGKAAKLGEISEVVARAGGEVPPGLALTVDAYRQFLKESGIAAALDRIAADPELAPEERAARARKLILDAPLTADSGVGASIVAALRAENLEGTMLAVRSSAVDEDGAEAAFAGAGDTHLYVEPSDLLPHVKEIWASLWNPRALLYRQTKGLSTTNLAQAVVVQAMADSQVSGVAFTQDPVSGDSSRLIVNAAFGLGEGVVSGRVAPDQYVVGKALGREILPPMISDKKLAIVRGKNGVGTDEHKMPAEWRRRRALSPAQLEKLNAVALALENHFGYALDIEFGFVGDKLYVLQARPVTNAATEEPAPPAMKTVKAASAPKPKTLLFVCTGNTCRSPMAERLAKEKLAYQGRDDVAVASRGLGVAETGSAMTDGAQSALRGLGVDADGHAAAPLSPADVAGANVILAMTKAQAAAILELYPQAKGKVFTLGEYSGVGGDVNDPYNRGEQAYRVAAARIAAAVDSALDREELTASAPVAAAH